MTDLLKTTLRKNHNPAGPHWNVAVGLAYLVDGTVRLVTLGYCCTTLPTAVMSKSVEAAHRVVRERVEELRRRKDHERRKGPVNRRRQHRRQGNE